MLKTAISRSAIVAFAGALSLSASVMADATKHAIHIPSGDLATALELLAKQSGSDLVYRPDQVQGFETGGVEGELSTEEAVSRLLKGTPLTPRTDSTGAILIALPTPTAQNDGARSALDAASGEKKSSWSRLAQSDIQSSSEARARGENSGKETADQKDPGQSQKRVGLEEIVVTATKRSEHVQDVPMSISVIGNQEIERRGFIGMEDYLRSTPGVNQIDNGPYSNAIIIRGITTSPISENNSSGATVASYFDETPITGAAGMAAGGIDIRPVDIERIEVLRGPQGTAYGSASLGGALRIIPYKPDLNAFGANVSGNYSNTAGYGSDNSMGTGRDQHSSGA